MKTGRTLTELAQEIERRANAKQDFIAPAAKIAMTQEATLALGDEHAPKAMNGTAHSQLAEYVGIPKPYYDRCPPALLAPQVNHWLREKNGDRRMIRTLDGGVRALLSDRYRTLENEDLAEAILPVLFDMNLLVTSAEITERRLYIKAIDKRIERDIPTGKHMGDSSHTFFDTVSPAIIVSNSEIGYGRLSIETGVYTRVCTNLAMIGTNFKKQHVGGRSELSEDVYALLSDNTKKLTDAAVWGQVRDVVKGAFDAVRFQATVEKLTGATEDKIGADVVQVVERVGKRFGIGEGDRKSILAHLIEGADLTRYGLHSAITRASQDVADYDSATEMERFGGQVIELPRHEWAELAKAA